MDKQNVLMKNSGIEWIGKTPNDWSLERLQWYLDEIKELNNPIKTEQVLSLTNKLGVVPYEEKGDQGNKAKENLNEYKVAYPNTIVANSMNILIGSVGICNYTGCVSPVYYVFKPNKKCSIRFINYILQTEGFQKELRKYANGILEIRLRVSSSGILKRKIAIPNIDTQNNISNYIDSKVEKINDLIKNQEQQIEKLKEYKQSLITEVVTKGLDKNAKMKYSGVEWIGKIPKDWQVIKLKYAYNNIEEKYNSGEYPYIALENIESKSGNYVETETNKNYSLEGTIIADKNAVIFGKLRPYLTKAFLITEPSCVSSEFAVFVSNGNSTEYLKYLFLSYNFIDWINSSTYGTKMPRANIDFIKNTYITLPNVKEQNKIVSFIKTQCVKIDNMINIKKEKIEKLNEYKKSLIYEYVTGKKEV